MTDDILSSDAVLSVSAVTSSETISHFLTHLHLHVAQCIFFYYTGILPFVRLNEDILGIPIDRVDYARVREQKALKVLPDAVCAILAFVLGGKPPSALIPPGLFKHLRARGIPIFFLGVNDEEDLKVRRRLL